MTNKEMALAIGKTVRELQAKVGALEMLLSQVRFEGESIAWQARIETDLQTDLAPSSPFGRSVARLEEELAESPDTASLEVVYKRIFLPDYSD